MESGGKRATRTGRSLESSVASILESMGYRRVKPAKDFFAFIRAKQPVYATQCNAGKNLYNLNWRVDFIIYHPEKWPNCLVIECKWQAERGSVDHKYPFIVMNINKNNYPAIIVLDGGAYSEGSKSWLYAQAGTGNLLEVMDLGGFQRFATRQKL